MGEAKHTPKPWGCKAAGDPKTNPTWWITSGTQSIIAKTVGSNDQANAERIVGCVNAHDKLLAACKKLVYVLEAKFPECGSTIASWRDAIAKAEEEVT